MFVDLVAVAGLGLGLAFSVFLYEEAAAMVALRPERLTLRDQERLTLRGSNLAAAATTTTTTIIITTNTSYYSYEPHPQDLLLTTITTHTSYYYEPHPEDLLLLLLFFHESGAVLVLMMPVLVMRRPASMQPQ